MPALILPDRTVIRVDGADAQHFLQNLVTANVEAIKPGEAQPAALLTPQGKILFDFLVSKAGETAYDCDIRSDLADDFIRRLTLYKLRAAVRFEALGQPVIAGWDGEAPAGALRDLRFPREANVWRLYDEGPALDADRAAWDAIRIKFGVAESGADFALSDVFPHDILMDRNGGVDFRKGCYVGQEVVSRMQHRGTARRRVAVLTAAKDLPAASDTGAEIGILAGGKPAGSLGSVAGKAGLAIVRTDRVADALSQGLQLTLDGVPVTLTLPGWTGLSFNSGDANASDH
ncbi:YgfZ/GcvT domain-containing protein [Hoeflea alexandrii]|uniref:CAF17-like 4Fe-4S cluster assembly/insertion protein YgfZ n=1 Tax=Hoeflea alexandrii TaxID=288436 RepID=UPI0022AF9EB6|nr:folate-binding protein YgfZ [Hoeflea alexandrii]MCZ4289079.1 folate-binding protein YgfZ [Hoeflea alexandrii]